MKLFLLAIIIAFYLNVDVHCENCFPKVKSNSFWVQNGHPLVVNCSIQNCKSRYVLAQWWMKGKRVYGMDFTKRIYETNFLNYTKLVIDPVKSEDAGIFTCINNVDSTKNISILLNVGVPTSLTPPTSGVSRLLPLFKETSLLIFIIYILK